MFRTPERLHRKVKFGLNHPVMGVPQYRFQSPMILRAVMGDSPLSLVWTLSELSRGVHVRSVRVGSDVFLAGSPLLPQQLVPVVLGFDPFDVWPLTVFQE